MSTQDQDIQIYRPYGSDVRGWAVWREMFAQLLTSRELTWRLFVRDFNVRYRQTLLGPLWTILMPLVAVATFTLLNKAGVLVHGDEASKVPYHVFALFGLTVWQVFAGGVTACSRSIVDTGDLITKVRLPWIALLASAMGTVLLDFLVRVGLLAIVCAISGVKPTWGVVLFPLVILPMFLITFAIGFATATVSIIFRDVDRFAGVATGLLMFLTPVVYGYPESGLLATCMKWNPLAPLVDSVREIVLFGTFSHPNGFALSSVFAFVLFLLGWRLFHIAQMLIAERV